MSAYDAIFAATVPIIAKVLPSVERWIPNDVSLFELSVQERSISLAETGTAVKPVGAAGVDRGAAVGVGVAVGVAVGFGVAVGVGLGVSVALGLGVSVGVEEGVALGVGVGLGKACPVNAANNADRPSEES